jgi:hypothetical protein
VIRPRARRSGVLLPIGAWNLFLLQNFQTHGGVHPAFYSMGTGSVLSPGVKRRGSETDSSPPPSAGIMNKWSYISTPSYAFVTCTEIALLFFFNIF